jgi:plastocyanin
MNDWLLTGGLPRLFRIAVLLLLSPGVLMAHEEAVVDVGKFNGVKYQEAKELGGVTEIVISEGVVSAPETVAEVYRTVIFQNGDDESHLLVFLPGVRNDLEHDITSPLIEPGERWGVEFHSDGIYPYHCTIHPEVRGVVEVQW